MISNEPKTCGEAAYDTLRGIILAGDLPIGEFLSQRKLAELSNTSLTSVRDALRRLENMGLIENVPRWGVRIPVVDERKITESYFLRELLEVAAVKCIRDKNSPEQIKLLKHKAELCDSVVVDDPENIELFAQRHFNFHHAIAECSGNNMMIVALERLNLQGMMFWNAKRGWGHGVDVAMHRKFVDDIFSEDSNFAKQAVIEHVQRGLRAELAALESER